jgi:ATP-dependent Clp protease ATP-binding subunit ClpX
MSEVYQNVLTDDLVDFGLIPELIGRLPIHTYTRTLRKDDIKRVMTETKNGVVKQFEALFAVDGINLRFNADAIDYVAEKVIKDKIGVRGLRKVLEKELRNIQYDIEDYTARNISTVVVSKDQKFNKLKTTFRYYSKLKSKKSQNDK